MDALFSVARGGLWVLNEPQVRGARFRLGEFKREQQFAQVSAVSVRVRNDSTIADGEFVGIREIEATQRRRFLAVLVLNFRAVALRFRSAGPVD